MTGGEAPPARSAHRKNCHVERSEREPRATNSVVEEHPISSGASAHRIRAAVPLQRHRLDRLRTPISASSACPVPEMSHRTAGERTRVPESQRPAELTPVFGVPRFSAAFVAARRARTTPGSSVTLRRFLEGNNEITCTIRTCFQASYLIIDVPHESVSYARPSPPRKRRRNAALQTLA